MTHMAHHIIACALAVTLFTACEHEEAVPLDVPVQLLKNGDLALRCGTSLESHVVVGINNENGPYSHIGVVVLLDGQWFVAHAVPGENEPGEAEYVKLEPIETYYGNDRAKSGCIMRVSDDSAACRKATDYALWTVKARKIFDTQFDWEDTTSLYCTELVQQAYLHSGIDLAQDRHTRVSAALFKGTYVFPCDITANPALRAVCEF